MVRTFEPESDDVLEAPAAEDIRAWILAAISRSRYDHPEAVVVEEAEEDS